MELKMKSLLDNIRVFRFVLINMFVAAHHEMKNEQTMPHLTIADNSRSRTSEPTKKEKQAPKGNYTHAASSKRCTLWGRFPHGSTTCRSKNNAYADHANIPYIGSVVHSRW